MHQHDLKTAVDGVSVTTAMAAFFEAIPFAEIAAFLSCIWILTRLYEYFKCKWVERKQPEADKQKDK